VTVQKREIVKPGLIVTDVTFQKPITGMEREDEDKDGEL
jgi:hypothetical protein